MNSRTALTILVATAACLAASGPADAGLLLFDNFDSPGATVGDDANDPTDVPWTGSNSPVSSSNLSVGNKAFSSPRGLYNQGGGTYRYATGAVPALQSLTSPGQSLVLDVQFRTNNAGALNNNVDSNDGYQIGLFAPDNRGYFMNVAAGNDASDLSWKKDTDGNVHLAGAAGNTPLSTFGTGAPTVDDNDYDKVRLTY